MTQKEKAMLKWLKLNAKHKFVDFDEVDDIDFSDTLTLYKSKKPKLTDKKRYVGIEIECFSSCSEIQLIEALYKANLQKKVDIGSDSSIEPNNYNQRDYEIRIMDTEKNINKTIIKVMKILKKLKFQVNNTCGLHVHLDSRNRDKVETYTKLLKAQNLLYCLVDKSRVDNDYCKMATETSIQDKYRAINYNQYGKTIEVRLHEGSLDWLKVTSWISLLLKIVNHKTGDWVRTPDGFKRRIGSTPKLSRYFKSTYVPRAAGLDYDAA